LIGYGKTNRFYQLPLIKLFDSLIFIENTDTTPLPVKWQLHNYYNGWALGLMGK
jgi:hypothetical protein